MSKFYRFCYRLLSGFFRWMYRVEIHGAENEPKEGALLVCANHTSLSDVVLLGSCLHRQVRFFAKSELFKIPIFRHLIRALGAYPVKRGQADVQAIRNTLQLLKDGEVVGVFPQGHRYPGVRPEETPAKAGIGMMVNRSHASVLPIAISSKGYKLRPFRRNILTIGTPISYESLHIAAPTPTEYQRAADEIFKAITDMVQDLS